MKHSSRKMRLFPYKLSTLFYLHFLHFLHFFTLFYSFLHFFPFTAFYTHTISTLLGYLHFTPSTECIGTPLTRNPTTFVSNILLEKCAVFSLKIIYTFLSTLSTLSTLFYTFLHFFPFTAFYTHTISKLLRYLHFTPSTECIGTPLTRNPTTFV